MLDFEGQALLATQRADLTETARRELDVALSEAQVALEEAVAAKAAAVELEAAAEARARQATDRIAGEGLSVVIVLIITACSQVVSIPPEWL
jgi:hypothetical protein